MSYLPLLTYQYSHNLNHLSAYHYHVTSSRMSLGLRVYSSPLFFDPVSLLMAYQQKGSYRGFQDHFFLNHPYLSLPVTGYGKLKA